MKALYHPLLILLISMINLQGEEKNHDKPNMVILAEQSFYFGSDVQHPLVCGQNRDFPKGQEFLVNSANTSTLTHIVFPKRSKVPQNIQGKFIFRGYFQVIQDRSAYTMKQPKKNYRYFVVTSWEKVAMANKAK